MKKGIRLITKSKLIIFSLAVASTTACTSQPMSQPSSEPPAQPMSQPPAQPTNEFKPQVQRTIHNHLKELTTCYEATLERIPKFEGKLVVQWQINKEGKVTHFTPVKESSTLTDERFIQCVGDAFATWQFPIPPDEDLAEITYPFFFRHENRHK
ncbi:MAG: AgmX/PglI C-terminal domain-containing protein [Pseudobdellovibrionaceae bacterium]